MGQIDYGQMAKRLMMQPQLIGSVIPFQRRTPTGEVPGLPEIGPAGGRGGGPSATLTWGNRGITNYPARVTDARPPSIPEYAANRKPAFTADIGRDFRMNNVKKHEMTPEAQKMHDFLNSEAGRYWLAKEFQQP